MGEGFSSFEEFKKWAYESEDSIYYRRTKKFNAYAYQMNIEVGNFKKNIDKVKNIFPKIDKNSLVLLPELFSSGFHDSKNILKKAEFYTMEFLQDYLVPLSEKNDLTIVGTMPYFEEDDLFNKAFVVDNGKLILSRSKYYLFKLTEEDKMYKRGERNFEAVITSKGRLGIMICYELRFPDIALSFFLQKIDVLLVPAEWGRKRAEHLKVLSKARAIEQRAFCMVSDAVGMVGDVEMAGCSAVYSPWGEELAIADETNEALIQAKVDLNEVEKVERYFRGRD